MLVLVLGCFLAGIALQPLLRGGRLRVARVLDLAVLDVALPALVLAKVPKIPLDAGALVPVAVAWSCLTLAVGAVLAVARWQRWDRRRTGTLLLVAPLGNTSFLGLAAVGGLLGADHLGAALTYDQLGTFLGLALYGSLVVSRYGERKGAAPSPLLRLLTFPPFVALLLTIPLRTWPLPHAALRALTDVGILVAPLAMTALGLRFRPVLKRAVLAPAAACLAVKMVLLPLAALAVAELLGVRTDVAWSTSVLEAGAPPMVTAGVVVASAGLDAEVATTAIGLGIAVALFSLPLLSLAVR